VKGIQAIAIFAGIVLTMALQNHWRNRMFRNPAASVAVWWQAKRSGAVATNGRP